MPVLETVYPSIFLGLLATTNPCVLPLYPGFLAYLSSSTHVEGRLHSRFLLGFFVLAGVLSMMFFLGFIISLLSISIGRTLSVLVPLADFLILILGILLLADRNPFKSLPHIKPPGFSHLHVNAFLYGILYGPIVLPCSGPLVVGIFAFSFTAAEAADKLMVFLGFGLGFGLPLFLLSFLSGKVQRSLTRFLAVHSRKINIFAGLLLIGIAISDFIANWDLVAAFWP